MALKPVYDILDCGPRHRFVANGRLVHNSNFQNLKKDDPEYPREKGGLNIRDSIQAPDGYLLVKPDASQIECRLVNFIAGQDDKIEDFRQGRDPYIGVASAFYGFEVNKKDHPKERQVGKILELQAGFGSGAAKIGATLRTKAGIILSPADQLLARDAYRNTHPAVVDLWKTGGRMISRLAGGPPVEWGPTTVRDGNIYLPNGCPMIYVLEYYRDPDIGEEYWRRKTRRGWVKIYGAKVVENLIQGLARVLVSQAMIRVARKGYRLVSMEHDSLWVLVPRDGQEAQHVHNIRQEFVREPEWLPGIPLDCECELPR